MLAWSQKQYDNLTSLGRTSHYSKTKTSARSQNHSKIVHSFQKSLTDNIPEKVSGEWVPANGIVEVSVWAARESRSSSLDSTVSWRFHSRLRTASPVLPFCGFWHILLIFLINISAVSLLHQTVSRRVSCISQALLLPGARTIRLTIPSHFSLIAFLVKSQEPCPMTFCLENQCYEFRNRLPNLPKSDHRANFLVLLV